MIMADVKLVKTPILCICRQFVNINNYYYFTVTGYHIILATDARGQNERASESEKERDRENLRMSE